MRQLSFTLLQFLTIVLHCNICIASSYCACEQDETRSECAIWNGMEWHYPNTFWTGWSGIIIYGWTSIICYLLKWTWWDDDGSERGAQHRRSFTQNGIIGRTKKADNIASIMIDKSSTVCASSQSLFTLLIAFNAGYLQVRCGCPLCFIFVKYFILVAMMGCFAFLSCCTRLSLMFLRNCFCCSKIRTFRRSRVFWGYMVRWLIYSKRYLEKKWSNLAHMLSCVLLFLMFAWWKLHLTFVIVLMLVFSMGFMVSHRLCYSSYSSDLSIRFSRPWSLIK